VEAARALADLPAASLGEVERQAFADFVAAQRVNADQPESHLRLGLFYVQRGQTSLAEQAYWDAIRVGARHVGGYLNLADLYRAQRRDGEGEQVLREGLRQVYQPAALHHSLGLLLVRRRALDEALVELGRAVELEPLVPRFAHGYGVALHSVGREAEARRVLEAALRQHPDDPELGATLASWSAR
jgi:Flp pilus assembly protein TadD